MVGDTNWSEITSSRVQATSQRTSSGEKTVVSLVSSVSMHLAVRPSGWREWLTKTSHTAIVATNTEWTLESDAKLQRR